MSIDDVNMLLQGVRVLAAAEDGRAVPSPSSVAKCTRRNWYVAHGQEPDNFPDNGESIISAKSGTASEPFLTLAVEALGATMEFAVDSPARELRDDELDAISAAGGQLDNVAVLPDGEYVLVEFKRKGVLDIKSLVQRGLGGMPDGQVLLDAIPDEYTQLQMLMHGLRAGRYRSLERAYYVAANWDRGSWTRECVRFGKPAKWLEELGVTERPAGLWVEWVPYNLRMAQSAVLRATMQQAYIDTEENPAKVPKDPTQTDYKGATKEFSWDNFPCTWCAYLKACKNAG